MSRKIYLISYDSPLFPAHWALWIPSASNPSLGKIIHVTGDAAQGFELQFKRNYDISITQRKHHIIPIGSVDNSHIVDGPGGRTVTDDVPTEGDTLEETAAKIPAPAKSLVSALGGGVRLLLFVKLALMLKFALSVQGENGD
jgi:hypothetical protein